jgi:hypothetical protein
MKRLALPLLALLLAVPATGQGRLGTLRVGEYRCELPGDAAGPSRHPVPEEHFEVLNASSYRTAQGGGTYLLTGNRLIMTSGPKRGQKYTRFSDNFLRKLDEAGNESPLRCVRRTLNGG